MKRRPVAHLCSCLLLWASLALAAPAGEIADLLDLPVRACVPASGEQRRAAASLAAHRALPVAVALHAAGPFEGARQLIVQANEGAEAATVTRVTLIRDGLLDDALRSERWDVALKRNAAGHWQVLDIQRSWRCRRGGTASAFGADRCP